MEKNKRLLFGVNGLVWLFGTACTPLVNISSLINIVILFGTNKVVFLLLFEKPTSLNTFFHGHATYYALLHSVFTKLMQH